jgi:hypothetical protein
MGVIGVLHTHVVSRTADPPAVSSQARARKHERTRNATIGEPEIMNTD